MGCGIGGAGRLKNKQFDKAKSYSIFGSHFVRISRWCCFLLSKLTDSQIWRTLQLYQLDHNYRNKFSIFDKLIGNLITKTKRNAKLLLYYFIDYLFQSNIYIISEIQCFVEVLEMLTITPG